MYFSVAVPLFDFTLFRAPIMEDHGNPVCGWFFVRRLSPDLRRGL